MIVPTCYYVLALVCPNDKTVLLVDVLKSALKRQTEKKKASFRLITSKSHNFPKLTFQENQMLCLSLDSLDDRFVLTNLFLEREVRSKNPKPKRGGISVLPNENHPSPPLSSVARYAPTENI